MHNSDGMVSHQGRGGYKNKLKEKYRERARDREFINSDDE